MIQLRHRECCSLLFPLSLSATKNFNNDIDRNRLCNSHCFSRTRGRKDARKEGGLGAPSSNFEKAETFSRPCNQGIESKISDYCALFVENQAEEMEKVEEV